MQSPEELSALVKNAKSITEVSKILFPPIESQEQWESALFSDHSVLFSFSFFVMINYFVNFTVSFTTFSSRTSHLNCFSLHWLEFPFEFHQAFQKRRFW